MAQAKKTREDFPSHAAYLAYLYDKEPRTDGVIVKLYDTSAKLEDGTYISQWFCRYNVWEVGATVNYPPRYAAIKGKK